MYIIEKQKLRKELTACMSARPTEAEKQIYKLYQDLIDTPSGIGNVLAVFGKLNDRVVEDSLGTKLTSKAQYRIRVLCEYMFNLAREIATPAECLSERKETMGFSVRWPEDEYQRFCAVREFEKAHPEEFEKPSPGVEPWVKELDE